MKKVVFVIFFLVFANSFGQIADSKGKEFFITFLPNYHNNAYNNDPYLRFGDSLYIIISSDEPTNGYILYTSIKNKKDSLAFQIDDVNKIFIFKVSWFDYELRGFNASGELSMMNQSEIISQNSFRVVTDKEVNVYVHQQAVTSADSFNAFPIEALGNEYIISSYYSSGLDDTYGDISGQSTPSQFAVVATEDSTNIKIIPSVPTYYNGLNEQNIIMNRGEVYLVQASITTKLLDLDLTGTQVISDKPVAIFSGHQRAKIPLEVSGDVLSRDMLAEQLPPIKYWATEFIITPFPVPSRVEIIDKTDIYRILSASDNNRIFINGEYVCSLSKGKFKDFGLYEPAFVESDNPVLITTFKKTSMRNPGGEYVSDPIMTIVPGIEQFGNYSKFLSVQVCEFKDLELGVPVYDSVYLEHYCTIVVPEASVNSVVLDGKPINRFKFMNINNTKYFWTVVKISSGVHKISAPDKFSLFVSGYGFAASYGYNVGMNFKNYKLDSPVITCNNLLCQGEDIILTADSIPLAQYHWFGPDGFESDQRKCIIKNATIRNSGKYSLFITKGNFVSDTVTVNIDVINNNLSPDSENLAFTGSASNMNEFIKLTNPTEWNSGSVWLKDMYSIKQNFTHIFSFKIRFCSNNNEIDSSIQGADGFAFVLQNKFNPVTGLKGGGLGYSEISNSIAIEYDLFKNYWDPNGNHIAVQSMGDEPNTQNHLITKSCIGINDSIIVIKPDSVYYSKIEYNWEQKTMKIYLDNKEIFDLPVLVIENFDITEYIDLEKNEYVYTGFTASTGNAFQEHDLLSWKLPCVNKLVNIESDNAESTCCIISPNPATDFITINLQPSKGLNPEEGLVVEIYDMLGVKVISEPIHPMTSSHRMNIENLPAGVYLIKIGNIFEKFIKMK